MLKRIGAISHKKNETVYFFGYGVYVGEEVPPPGVKFLGIELHDLQEENPKLLLDNGDVVWGCECWWGEEGHVQRGMEGKTVEMISIIEAREKYSNPTPPQEKE